MDMNEKTNMTFEQLEWIRFGIEAGLDVSTYSDPKDNYSPKQMEQMYRALEAGINPRDFASPSTPFTTMAVMRHLAMKQKAQSGEITDPRMVEHYYDEFVFSGSWQEAWELVQTPSGKFLKPRFMAWLCNAVELDWKFIFKFKNPPAEAVEIAKALGGKKYVEVEKDGLEKT